MSKVYLVTFKDQDQQGNKAKLKRHVEKHAAKYAARGLSKRPKIKRELEKLPSIFIIDDVDQELLEDLRNDPNVLAIEEDQEIPINMAQKSEWSHPLMDVSGFHSRGYTGEGVKVGIIDTGAAPHEDLVYAGTYNAYTAVYGGTTPAAADYSGHGTSVAGIIGARNNDKGYIGVAPDCLLYSAKADDNTGGGLSVSAIIEAVNWLVTQNVKIVNCSFGNSIDSLVLADAFKRAYQNYDVLFVCAAGNEGSNTNNNIEHYPSDYDFTVSVACLKNNKEPAVYSNRSPKIDVAAPGDGVMTTARSTANQQGTDYITPSTSYGSFNGTSCAAPHITGLAALYKQMFPSYSPAFLKLGILYYVERLGTNSRNVVFGEGMAISPWATVTDYTGKLISTAPTLANSVSDSMVNGRVKHFIYVANATGNHTFQTSSSIDLFMRVYNSNYHLIGYDDDGGGNAQPKVTVYLVQVSTYYIAVSGYSNAQNGPYTLNVTAPSGEITLPSTVVEDFTDDKLEWGMDIGKFTLDKKDNGCVWAVVSDRSTSQPEINFVVYAPSKAATRSLHMDFSRYLVYGDANGGYVDIYVKGILKYSNNTVGQTYTNTGNIPLDAGNNNVRIVFRWGKSGASGQNLVMIDKITVALA
ncbi:S8 family peptidase [Brevibacillus sp. B_LB10_24]|uniref:S8 family peptidase n=1 Tax=Brevibacillus sp. B_LB10_24 TaxID=3380645 RepID=UPI0038B73765